MHAKRKNIFSRFSSNSEAFASELLRGHLNIYIFKRVNPFVYGKLCPYYRLSIDTDSNQHPENNSPRFFSNNNNIYLYSAFL